MKRLILLLCACFLVLSCSEDDEPQSSSTELLGVWSCTSTNYSGTSTTEFGGDQIITEFIGEGSDYNYTITIKENPNVITTDGSYSIKLTSTALGQTFVQNISDLTFSGVGSWSLEGDQITITDEKAISTATIITLTETTLELFIYSEFSESTNGVTVTAITETEASFIRN